MKCADWSDFKRICITKKNLSLQFEEWDDRIRVVGPDSNGINWEITLGKKLEDGSDNPDATDFTQNIKLACNWAIGARPYAFATGDFEFIPSAVVDTCPAGSFKVALIRIDQTMYVNGGRLVTDSNATFGDWLEVQLVDHDNLLGYGADTVLKNWIPKWYVSWKAGSETVQTPYAGLPPVGMYLRSTYHSVGSVDVAFAVNYLFHKPI